MKMFPYAAALMFAAAMAFADPVEGIWQTKKDDRAHSDKCAAVFG